MEKVANLLQNVGGWQLEGELGGRGGRNYYSLKESHRKFRCVRAGAVKPI